jgi:hypothetical protein
MPKFRAIAHLPYSPAPEGLRRAYPRRGHNTAGRYYQSLMYIELGTSDVLHKKPATWDRGYTELPRIH